MWERVRQAVARLDQAVARSFVGSYFRLEGSGHPLERQGARFSVEIRAGAVTFAAMAYILAVNASILSESGGPCECRGGSGVCMKDPDYLACQNDLRRAYVVATAAAACIASGLMGLSANMPLGLAPGLGANAYFAYTVVGAAGSGTVSYSQALGVVWLEGWIFVLLSILGVRQWLARVLPKSLKLSTGVGIGVYLALIGLGPGGLDVVGLDFDNLLGFAGCLPQYRDSEHSNACLSHVLQDPRVWEAFSSVVC